MGIAAKARRPRKNELYSSNALAEFFMATVFSLVGAIPKQRGPERNKALVRLATSEPLFCGALYSALTRISNARYSIVGSSENVGRTREILAAAEFGRGLRPLIHAVTFGALTTDSGGWVEIARRTIERKTRHEVTAIHTPEGRVWVIKSSGTVVDPADVVYDPDSPPVFLSLDPTRCVPTEDSDYPLQYLREDGLAITLSNRECFQIVDNPQPGTSWGFCAASRLAQAVSFMASLLSWHQERVQGTMADTIVMTNAPARAVEDAMKQATEKAVSAGGHVYVPPVFLNPLDPSATPTAEVVRLKDLPEGFSLKDVMEWYVTVLANGLGVDYGSIAPLPGSRLGAATEAEVMARLAAMRLYGIILRQFEHNLNRVLPAQIEFVPTDLTEARLQAEAALMRAQERARRISSGELTVNIARQIAADVGDLRMEYLQVMEGKDITPEE